MQQLVNKSGQLISHKHGCLLRKGRPSRPSSPRALTTSGQYHDRADAMTLTYCSRDWTRTKACPETGCHVKTSQSTTRHNQHPHVEAPEPLVGHEAKVPWELEQPIALQEKVPRTISLIQLPISAEVSPDSKRPRARSHSTSSANPSAHLSLVTPSEMK